MNDGMLSCLGFELAYLALLTKNDLKRLSRWESTLSQEQTAALRDLGLEVAEVRRSLVLGRKKRVTVFSSRKRWTDLYRARFDLTRMKTTPDEIRLKGFLFGYPGCCVDAFIREPYTANDLRTEDQEILFHWACRGCRVTPGLLMDYRDIYRECVTIFGHEHMLKEGPFPGRRQASAPFVQAIARRQAVPVAAGLSTLLLMTLGGCSRSDSVCGPDADTEHLLSVEDDGDRDYLSYAEEILAGTNPADPDTDGDGVLDGIDHAKRVWRQYKSLTGKPSSHEPYVDANFMQMGTEVCQICGAVVNMGGVTVVNPAREKSIYIPLICLHYLEHGSFSYDGSVHTGRLDLARFRRKLPEFDRRHAVVEGCARTRDRDGDGLCDEEETALGTDPDRADTDGDSVSDGPQLTEDLLEAISTLPREPREHEPYLIERNQRGSETCEVCGSRFNMGGVTIFNPDKGLSIDVPWVALHYLAHGSFSHRGTTNTGRVSPVELREVLDF